MITVIREPIILIETVEMLYKVANGISFESVKSDFIRRYAANRDDAWKQSICDKATTLAKVCADVCSELSPKDPTLQYYFAGYSSAVSPSKCCLAQIMTWILGAYNTDFDMHVSNLKTAWKNKIANNDPIMLSPGISLQYAKDVPWAVDIAENIDAIQYPEEFRWRLFKLISNADMYIDELADFLRPIARKLSVALASYAEESERVCSYWEEYFKSNSSKEFALSFCNVDTDNVDDYNLYIYVNSMNATSVVSEMEVNCTNDWYVHIGCMLDGEIPYADNNVIIDEMCEMLKVLSDKSKFQILRAISSASAYGTELADQMGLTNATISRHMNTLFNLGFITAEKKNAKIYYRTNKERLAKFLQALSDELLK